MASIVYASMGICRNCIGILVTKHKKITYFVSTKFGGILSQIGYIKARAMFLYEILCES